MKTEEMIQELEDSGLYRVLEKIEPKEYYNTNDHSVEVKIGVYVDVETTGIDPGTDKIIEVGMISFEFSPDGKIYRLLDSLTQFNDPGFPIPATITKLTGITDRMVAGQSLDHGKINDMINPAVVVIAHHARFDNAFLSPEIPLFQKKAWACSVRDIDWAAENMESTKLEFITYKMGYFYDGHRAVNDVQAGIQILASTLPVSGEPALKALLDKAREKEYRIWADRSPFEAKDVLKRRGYTWNNGENGQPKSWFIEIAGDKVKEEINYLHNQIYGKEVELRIDIVTAFNRYSLDLIRTKDYSGN